ncbi:MAG: Gfo/Idh/MocA family oxidoreductase [Planctomycetes bacterium]|nr:Gfo/Idh/MocA family oxidoreductase [Planctomycetota bacterium]
MLQVLQNINDGRLRVASLPDPLARPGQVLIANAASVISAGTERQTIELARKSLLGKARERPDHVRRVIEKFRQEGFFNTLRQVREKLDEPLALGYSSAGVVLACGAGVSEFKPGDRVASNGPHAGIVSVPKHLCAHVPVNVNLDRAAFTVIGSIALQSVRLARLELGETAFVIGLGLVGQLAVSLLRASGVRVFGTDPDPAKCELALRMGATAAGTDWTPARLIDATNGLGADAVLIAASTPSDEPVTQAADAVRKKGRIVAVGAVGLNLPRRPLYFKEAEFVVSCSYGPGRYDPAYEERGQDYPAGYVRWTEQRNMQAVLDLMAAGKLDVSPLISHRYSIERAEEAYALLDSGSEPYLGVVLEYPEVAPGAEVRRIELRAPASAGPLGIACLGSGNFARMTLLPLLLQQPNVRPVLLVSAGGVSAERTGEKHCFEGVGTDEAQAFSDPNVRAVFVLTRHDQHAGQVVRALRAGKHVFVEKPLALNGEELAEVEATLAQSGSGAPVLTVGFNRRFAPGVRKLKEFFAPVAQPLTISVRFNAGAIEPGHWTQDELQGGGRLIGEACHAIDLATYLAGSLPVRVFAESVGGAHAPDVTDDQCFITLRHANGSISSVAYLAGGDKAFPKERVEVFGGGRVGVLEDFRQLQTASGGRIKTEKLGAQDKGHAAELEAFVRALSQGGAAPIAWDDLRAVTLASILAVRSLREGIAFEIA